MSVIRYEELDQLAGELLPERTVLSVVSTPFNNNGGGASYFSGSSHQGSTAFSAVQGQTGLFGAVGLSSQSPIGNLGLAAAVSVL